MTAPTTHDFRNAREFLQRLDPTTTGRIIAAAADVALIVSEGVIEDIAFGSAELAAERLDEKWLGRPWVETVTVESRLKIEEMLQLRPMDYQRWRQVNHPAGNGADLPMRYTAIEMGSRDRLMALGRDQRSIARLQQQLMEAHQKLERDYSRLRAAETRYRLLFESVSSPVVVVEPGTDRVEEVNPAAARIFGRSVDEMVGVKIEDAFEPEARALVAQAIAESIAVGEARSQEVRTVSGASVRLTASSFRLGHESRVILRIDRDGAELSDPERDSQRSELVGLLEMLPDGLVVVGPDLRILSTNPAFAEMANVAHPGQLVGGVLGDYLGRSATDMNVLISSLKNHGVVRNFNTVLRDRFDREEEVEVSAVASSFGGAAAYGFAVRNVSRRLRSIQKAEPGLPSSAEQLTDLVGRVPLREIVRESTDFIERLCIEAALEITGDNRASAADVLGLSRQGLYSKLKRFGLVQ